MRNKAVKKLIAYAVAVAMIVSMVPLVPQTGEAGAASVSSPRVTADKTTWDCVYFGS